MLVEREREREGEFVPDLFWKLQKKYPDFAKIALWFRKKILFVCIHRLNSDLKFSFNSILERKRKIFPCLFLYAVHTMFIEVSLFQETSSAPKNSMFKKVSRNSHKLTLTEQKTRNSLWARNIPIGN